MYNIIQELSHKFLKSDVFIVGGGNSLSHFNFSSLQGRNVIAVNSSYKVLHDDVVIYWADSSWGGNEEDGLCIHPSPYKFTSRINVDVSNSKTRRSIAKSYLLKKTGDFGYDPIVTNVRGNNSGGQAINFAINLGAKRVILLGFDMGYVMNRSHFHSFHASSTPILTYNELFIPSINSLELETRNLPVEIINCSRQSRLTCFKFGNVQDYL